jgi:hypothetical protein
MIEKVEILHIHDKLIRITTPHDYFMYSHDAPPGDVYSAMAMALKAVGISASSQTLMPGNPVGDGPDPAWLEKGKAATRAWHKNRAAKLLLGERMLKMMTDPDASVMMKAAGRLLEAEATLPFTTEMAVALAMARALTTLLEPVPVET